MELEEVRKLTINPNEMLVVRYSDEKDFSFINSVTSQFKRLMPNVRVLVLTGVDEIAVISEEEEPHLKRGRRKSEST